MELNGAKILVTGGSLGIGRATASMLVEAGAGVAITGRNKARLEKTANEIGAHPIVADVSRSEDVDRTYSEFLDRFGKLDCLINNAGIGTHQPLVEITEQEFLQVWAVNVLGAAMMAQRAAQLFIKQRSGNIVNIASTSGLKGYETGTIYVASKFALRGMSECWRAELRKYNVRVITINPSEVTTAFGSTSGTERPEHDKKLRSRDIAQVIKNTLELDDRGFIPEATVWATNPW